MITFIPTPTGNNLNYDIYLSYALNWLESAGFNLYFDEKRLEWEIMNEESDWFLTDENKYQLIHQAFNHLKACFCPI